MARGDGLQSFKPDRRSRDLQKGFLETLCIMYVSYNLNFRFVFKRDKA